MRKCVNSANARIIPIPFEVAGAIQQIMIMRGRFELDAFCIDKGLEGLEELLPKVKKYIGVQVTLRSRQAKRLKRLLKKIKKYENTPDPSLLNNIVTEMLHLCISPQLLQD